MGFSEIKPTGPQKAKASGINAGLAKVRGSKAKLRLSIHQDVLDFAHWTPELPRFRVLIGSGTDAGVIRMEPAKDGPFELAQRKMPRGSGIMFSLRLGHLPSLPDIVAPVAKCEWDVLIGDVIAVTLPPFAKAKPEVVTRSAGETELDRQNREAKERRARMGIPS